MKKKLDGHMLFAMDANFEFTSFVDPEKSGDKSQPTTHPLQCLRTSAVLRKNKIAFIFLKT